ncbi:response regulator [Flocculibacter collagenilyticus]|uniref:response regulator n=1 Tax=Flocculibacter collagenilyticus TaxID=2744479 RepID=UPI0018F773CB|nr:response regulator [Flocculibacter collagenilyticus]
MSENTPDNAHLLIVEDDPVARSILEQLCKQNKYDYVSAIDGDEAVDIARKQSFDLMITDINMPNLDGISCVRQVRAMKKHRSVPVIALTGLDDFFIEDECSRVGVNKIVSKPVNPNEILASIKELLI